CPHEGDVAGSPVRLFRASRVGPLTARGGQRPRFFRGTHVGLVGYRAPEETSCGARLRSPASTASSTGSVGRSQERNAARASAVTSARLSGSASGHRHWPAIPKIAVRSTGSSRDRRGAVRSTSGASGGVYTVMGESYIS